MKRFIFLLVFFPVFILSAGLLSAESMYSPTWGFFLDLPEGYEYIDGDGKDRYSFQGPSNAMFDLIVYKGTYRNLNDLTNDVARRLGNSGEIDFFIYCKKQAAIIELNFRSFSGYGFCVELESGNQLLALAYGPADAEGLELFHISALDSISPSIDERFYPGPIIEYSYPRGEQKRQNLASSGISAMIYENDAETSQVLIEREFNLLRIYADTPFWKEAWIRYYRCVYRDSYDRVINAASALAQSWGAQGTGDDAKRAFAQKALTFVQGFKYERDFSGSDFMNLVTAVTEGRGDCDSRAMLWAILLSNAGLNSAMMVSPYYSHAMGLADISGAGARFSFLDINWLVAETTANIDIGLIAQEQSDPQYWIGVFFE